MKRSLLLVVGILLFASCGQRETALQNGDLLFVGSSADAASDSMDAAISSATGEEGKLNITHVAMVEVTGGKVFIIDATPSRGVDRHPLDTFLTDFQQADGKAPVFLARRVKGVDTNAAVERAKALCGKAYDLRFQPDNQELYCSELVQLCYLDADGKPVFESAPMNWLAPDGSMPPYWEKLFRELGMDVPQGVPGTNPQKMAESEYLIEINTNVLKPFYYEKEY